jgi:hypothetical protein
LASTMQLVILSLLSSVDQHQALSDKYLSKIGLSTQQQKQRARSIMIRTYLEFRGIRSGGSAHAGPGSHPSRTLLFDSHVSRINSSTQTTSSQFILVICLHPSTAQRESIPKMLRQMFPTDATKTVAALNLLRIIFLIDYAVAWAAAQSS